MKRLAAVLGVGVAVIMAAAVGGGAVRQAGGAGATGKVVVPAAAAGVTGIEAVAFLAGSWTGEVDGAYVEEMWSAPRGNNMMGSFRWLRANGTPMVFEMLALTAEGTGAEAAVRLRIRHFSPTLGAKEAADKPLTLRLARAEAGRAVFEPERDAGDLAGIEYAVRPDGALGVTVSFAAEGREALKFVLKKG